MQYILAERKIWVFGESHENMGLLYFIYINV